MIKRLLIANRGEIAYRIMRTAKRMNITCIAVFSEADKNMPHVLEADEAIHIGAAIATESYLSVEKIIAAAKFSNACAIHPGYGFLAENEALAKACDDNKIIFVGPSIDAIAAMGSKSMAKKIMQAANVPLLPGYHGDDQRLATLRREADQCGYPVLIKASAGGGGKGMRIVTSREVFATELASAKREAAAAFGNDQMIIEKYLLAPRHIEVQIFGDQHGNLVHLFDRDCSIQRRYQKVIEEAPAPRLTQAQRSDLYNAALRAGQAVNYYGAGTVEFICDTAGTCYFMEMNTRLQVEHPITEMITGIDLVEWQLRVAAHQALPVEQNDIQVSGHAIEARIYAEDVENGFLPASGKLAHLSFPEDQPGVRVDNGYQVNNEVGIHYDPMIAKLIVHADHRDAAVSLMQRSLTNSYIVGIKNNRHFLSKIVSDACFVNATYDTGFIDNKLTALTHIASDLVEQLIAIAAISLHLGDFTKPSKQRSPWQLNDSWSMNTVASRNYRFSVLNKNHTVNIHQDDKKFVAQNAECFNHFELESYSKNLLVLKKNGKRIVARTFQHDDKVSVFAYGEQLTADLLSAIRRTDAVAATGGTVYAPMPGKVVAITAVKDQPVNKGDPLITLEAMKMEHTLTAPCNGIVAKINFKIDEVVADNDLLVVVDAR